MRRQAHHDNRPCDTAVGEPGNIVPLKAVSESDLQSKSGGVLKHAYIAAQSNTSTAIALAIVVLSACQL